MDFLIRKTKGSDAESWIEMWNEGIKRKFFVYNGGNTPKTKKDIEEWKKRIAGKIHYVAIDKEKKIVIGTASFSPGSGRIKHRGELGWVVHPDYSRKGIATKLVGEVLKEAKRKGFKRAEAEASTKNIASIKIAKKFGFKIEGKRKKGLLLDNGKFNDTYLFGKIL